MLLTVGVGRFGRILPLALLYKARPNRFARLFDGSSLYYIVNNYVFVDSARNQPILELQQPRDRARMVSEFNLHRVIAGICVRNDQKLVTLAGPADGEVPVALELKQCLHRAALVDGQGLIDVKGRVLVIEKLLLFLREVGVVQAYQLAQTFAG